ncbi:BQ5605_C030g10785 [Microbotryum silenes-dioicae]|uniref:BQ5605_C030g10785 protein n=1 Tax=Microbotryum silenes-dioicae TaxID=796604 RepID=A0A2X0PI83_9BASI|nr:BQ5605_C030g10785 [Microbotryum silenes-dioicae]
MRSHYFAIIFLHCAWFGQVILATPVAVQTETTPEHRCVAAQAPGGESLRSPADRRTFHWLHLSSVTTGSNTNDAASPAYKVSRRSSDEPLPCKMRQGMQKRTIATVVSPFLRRCPPLGSKFDSRAFSSITL